MPKGLRIGAELLAAARAAEAAEAEECGGLRRAAQDALGWACFEQSVCRLAASRRLHESAEGDGCADAQPSTAAPRCFRILCLGRLDPAGYLRTRRDVPCNVPAAASRNEPGADGLARAGARIDRR